MYNIKTLLAAAAMTVAMAAGASTANAAPWDHHPDQRQIMRQEVRHDVRQDLRFDQARRPIVMRERVFETLRLHRYRNVGAPIFVRGHYVVKSFNRFGQVVFVEVDPYSGAFLGEFRI